MASVRLPNDYESLYGYMLGRFGTINASYGYA